jgi:hypothetical protein
VGEDGENLTTRFYPHQRPSWVKKKNKMMLALPCYKKERIEKIYYKKEKKNVKKRNIYR